MRKHGWTPRGLEAAGRQEVRGPAPGASPQFGSRFGRFFERSKVKFSEEALKALAEKMIAKPDDPKDGLDAEESGIPALYTYFGQFIDHDLTFDPEPDFQRFKDKEAVVDFRTAAFDLDNVYGRGKDDQPFMYDGDKFLLGTPIVHGFPNPDEARDLPRNSVGRALIGDPRNDENSIVSQLQGLFLRAHNRAIDAVTEQFGGDKTIDVFRTAQQMVRDHYQYVVVDDFLPKIVSHTVLSQLKTDNRWDLKKFKLFKGKEFDTPFMPVEFSVAGYRLGHSMVRPGYRLNDAILEPIFPFESETGRIFPEGLTGFRPLVSNWAIDWARFVPLEVRERGLDPDKTHKPRRQQTREMFERLQFAYKIDTSLVDPLGHLPSSVASDPPPSLAQRNLERGNEFGLLSGQECACKLGLTPLPAENLLIGKAIPHPSEEDKSVAIATIAGDAFKNDCPLWVYILAEARHHAIEMTIPVKGASVRVSTPQLGPVGGRIVAETFITLFQADKQSFLHQKPGWKPEGVNFGLIELVKYALGDKEVRLAPRNVIHFDMR
jgi:hypothetical protein